MYRVVTFTGELSEATYKLEKFLNDATKSISKIIDIQHSYYFAENYSVILLTYEVKRLIE